MSEYDVWDNGDRHEIRQQFAERKKLLNIACIQGFENREEADAHRKTFMHKDLHGLFQIFTPDCQLWCVLPVVALEAIVNFTEPKE